MKILVADDDSVYGATVAHLLERAGHRAIVVDNGEEAWRLMKGVEAPMVAILDWKMPGMTGVEICRKIRAREEFQPYLIMLTAHAEKDLMVAGFMAGADDYMVKPVDADELCARVRVGVRMVDMQAQYVDRAKQAEARYQSIFRNAVLGIYQTSPGGRFIRVNPAMARILGYRYPEELLAAVGEVSQDVYIEPGRRRDFVRAIEGRGVIDSFESQVKQRDGNVIWISEQARAVTDANGDTLYFEGTIQDVTAQKRSELALKESEHRLRVLVQNAPEAIVVFDADRGRFVDANKNAEKLYGLSLEALLETGPIELSPELQPNGEHSNVAAKRYVDSALAGNSLCFDWVHCDATGREFKCEIRLIRLPATDRNLVRGSLVDNAERLAAEKQLREHDQLLAGIFDSLTPELAVLNPDGVVVHASRSWLKAAPGCGEGSNYLELGFEKGRETANSLAGIQSVLAGTRTHFESELARVVDGQPHSFHMQVDPMSKDRGGVVVTHSDITEQRRSDAAMREEASRNAQLLKLESMLARTSGSSNICRVVAGQAEKLLPGSRCTVWRWDAASESWTATASVDQQGDVALLASADDNVDEAIYTDNSAGDPVLIMPVLNGLERMGAIICAGDIVAHARREETLRGLSSRLTQALLAERSRSEGLKQLLRLKLINEITHSIGKYFDLQSLLASILEHLERRQRVDFSGAFLFDEEAGGAMLHALGPASAARGEACGIQPGTTVAVTDPLAATVLELRSDYVRDTSAESANFASRLAEAGIGSVAVEPITVEKEVLGMLMVGRENSGGFSTDETDFLRQICEHVALAVYLRQQYASMQNAYREIQRKKEAAVRQQRLHALGEMAAGMVHDINNALSPILGYSQLILETERDISDTSRQQLNTVRMAANSIADMTNRVREFYRQRETCQPVASVPIADLVASAVELTRPRWRDIAQSNGKVIELTTDIAEAVPAIQGVESELREVLTNLIINAADAMPDGGVISIRAYTCGVDVSTPLRGARATRVVISVTDTGSGMDPTACQRCIDPFYSTKGANGTGLGLALVYGTVKRHEGDLKIESELGEGTTFRLVFPLRAQPNAALHTESDDAVTQSLQILFVDDEPALGSLIEAMLKPTGHRVTTAGNGLDALATLTAADEAGNPFDLVITDLGMPHMDGSELARRVKASWPGLPVILLTGWGRYTHEGIADEVDYVLSKPTDRQTLQRGIARVVNS
ncbi:MAG: PAS domain S-box-containing protein [Rhodothermales bacterium]|jgi:PAS domain S-box-containing protein